MDERTKVDNFLERARVIADTYDKDEAFEIISREVNFCDNKLINEYITALNQIRNEKVLDWIEKNIHRSTNLYFSDIIRSKYETCWSLSKF